MPCHIIMSSSDIQLKKQAAVAALKAECEEKWTQITQLYEDIQTHKKPHDELVRDDPLLKIYQAKEKRLKAEVEVLKNKETEALPKDPVVLHTLLKDELTTSITQLEHTLAMVAGQKAEMLKQIERDEARLEEQREIKAALEVKVEEIMAQETPGNERSYLKELEHKRKRAIEKNRELMLEMRDFIAKFFPPPTYNQMKEWRRSHQQPGLGRRSNESYTSSDSLNGDSVVSLQDMVEQLMNKLLDSPHDPYLTTDQSYWPPYLELLLRTGIALKHPEDGHRIKLVPFHL
ncbi:centromere protein K isoform X1 [Lingula anatina]|uniref:Centromere protein K isoform X1 n=2 Tax=Lingula anatina TaxID=7574 RepID=A0A1S3JPS2_LINAN|nr:centromere protein K isoform X1 [Lingula anatina]|eukprot:XP_013412363.1 centromere protein K isoform X1 [Lingula anatina]